MHHAWLIIAHNEFEILQMLVSSLDDAGNDIYIHFDKKVQVIPRIVTESSLLFILKDRIDVHWGTVSQIQCELTLMKAAAKNGPYEFYHIISGTHLPLKRKEEIHTFFNAFSGYELMNLWEEDLRDIGNKLHRFNFFVKGFTSRSGLVRKWAQANWRALQFIQKKTKVCRFPQEKFYKSDNWLSLTEPAVKYLTGNSDHILRKYRFSYCGDEYFVATELMGKKDAFHIIDTKLLLKVDFIHHNPKVYTLGDYPSLKASPCLFARKFSAEHIDVARLVLKHDR